jgi:hypothetical protein
LNGIETAEGRPTEIAKSDRSAEGAAVEKKNATESSEIGKERSVPPFAAPEVGRREAENVTLTNEIDIEIGWSPFYVSY